MVEQFTLQNLRSGKTIEFTKSTGQYIIDSVDWGVPSVEPITYRVPFQIGKVLSGVVTGSRPINIVGYVIPNYDIVPNIGMKWNDYYRTLEQTIESAKDELNKTINILDDVLIQVGEYEIKARPSETVRYSIEEDENNDVLCMFTIDLVAYSPLFVKKEKQIIDMSSVEGAFKFPLIIPEDKGIIMGVRKKIVNVGIVNNSDVPVGCSIFVTFLSSFQGDLYVRNINTQEYVGVVGLDAVRNDVLEIITNIGDEDIILNADGTKHSIISKLANGSVFLQMERGKNYYTYETSDSVLDAEIRIEFQELYNNFKEM